MMHTTNPAGRALRRMFDRSAFPSSFLLGLLEGFLCFLLLLGLEYLTPFLPDWACRVLLGAVILLAFLYSIYASETGRQRKPGSGWSIVGAMLTGALVWLARPVLPVAWQHTEIVSFASTLVFICVLTLLIDLLNQWKRFRQEENP